MDTAHEAPSLRSPSPRTQPTPPWWADPGQPDLDRRDGAYTRRFDLEHTIRSAKQTLGWATPGLWQPAQADCSTWMVPAAAYARLRLARQLAVDAGLL
jgi:hypothetical protein